METFCILIAALSTVLWVGFALLPWGLWRNREVLDAAPAATDAAAASARAPTSRRRVERGTEVSIASSFGS